MTETKNNAVSTNSLCQQPISPSPDQAVPLGQLVATPNALAHLEPSDIQGALQRHVQRDWGDLEAEDKLANDTALQSGERLLSAYHAKNGTKFWIITEADRSVTTVLLPEDY